MRSIRILMVILATLVSPAPSLFAQAFAAPETTADRLVRLADTPGVPAREERVRDAIRSMLPAWAKPQEDELGNLVLTIGSGQPSTLVVAALDEDGYVVSGITDNGYLRVHRPSRDPGHRLFDQFHVGQPVLIHTRIKGAVPGVTATPSTHLQRFVPAEETARIKGLEDLWIDVGAETRAQAEQLGIRILDAVTLRERAQRLAGGRVAGPSAQGRAGALALVELVRAWNGASAPRPAGTLTIAWASQTLFGNRGLNRLIEALHPQQVIVCGLAAPARGKQSDPRGAVGALGSGPLVAADDAEAATLARGRNIAVQPVPADRFLFRRPASFQGQVRIVSVPVLFAQTPVETVEARDAVLLAQVVAAWISEPAPATAAEDGRPAPRRASPPRGLERGTPKTTFSVLKPIIESYGVSGHEDETRTVILRLITQDIAPWAKPVVDDKGNIVVTFGEGADNLVFMAHMDELGHEITAIRDDGTAGVRARGGMFNSLYEAHPVWVHTARGQVAAVLAPRPGYFGAEESQPRAEEMALYFGSATASETAALGVTVGDAATVRKTLMPLAGRRASCRGLDDRAGSTALLLALGAIDPAMVKARVSFIWTVGEETGLVGATAAASRIKAKYAFAVDTFVSTDSPFDTKRIAYNPLGSGALLRGWDSSTASSPVLIDRLVVIAKLRAIPMTIGVTAGGTDASAFSRFGTADVGLSWPGRYSHSPAEVTDLRDVEALVKLIVAAATDRW